MNITELYKTYFTQLTETACRWVPMEDARDITQDVFLILWERREKLSDLTDIYAYAYAAVRNRSLDRLRHEAYIREYTNRAWALIVDTINMENPAHYIYFKETQRAIACAVDRLPRRCRQVFMLSREQGMRYNNIADTLGISVNTVENHISLALARLRQALLVA